MDIRHVKQGWTEAQRQKALVQSEIDNAFLYTNASRSLYKPQGQVADRTKQYDSTAMSSVNHLQAAVIAALIPVNSRWAYLDVLPDIRKGGIPADYKTFLQSENERLFELIQASNFYVASGSAIQECIIGGTGCVAIEMNEVGNGIIYVAVPTAQLYVLQNACGIIDVVYRKHQVPARDIAEDYSAPSWVADIADKNPNQLITIIECQYPDDSSGADDNSYYYAKYLEQDWTELDSYTCAYKPFTVFRWQTTAGDVWGDSPVRQALPDIRELNRMVENLAVASDFASQGAFQSTDDSLRGKQILPRTLVITGEGQDIKPIEFPGELQYEYKSIEALRMQIRNSLYDDMLPPTSDVKGVVATAINAMQAQFYRVLAVPALNLEHEFMREIIKNTVQIAQRNKLMTPLNAQKVGLCVDVESVVSKGQNLEAAQKIMATVSQLAPLGQAALSRINMTAMVDRLLELSDFPLDLINPPGQSQMSPEAMQAMLPQIATAIQGLAKAQTPQGAAPALPMTPPPTAA